MLDYKFYHLVHIRIYAYSHVCDNHLPEFFIGEFCNVWNRVNPIVCGRTRKAGFVHSCRLCHGFDLTELQASEIYNLTSEDIEHIKNFCACLFICLYLAYIEYPFESFNSELVYSYIMNMFGLDRNYKYERL